MLSWRLDHGRLHSALTGMAQLVGASLCPRRVGAYSWSGHTPWLLVQSPIGAHTGGNWSMFLSYTDVSLSLPSLSPKLRVDTLDTSRELSLHWYLHFLNLCFDFVMRTHYHFLAEKNNPFVSTHYFIYPKNSFSNFPYIIRYVNIYKSSLHFTSKDSEMIFSYI